MKRILKTALSLLLALILSTSGLIVMAEEPSSQANGEMPEIIELNNVKLTPAWDEVVILDGRMKRMTYAALDEEEKLAGFEYSRPIYSFSADGYSMTFQWDLEGTLSARVNTFRSELETCTLDVTQTFTLVQTATGQWDTGRKQVLRVPFYGPGKSVTVWVSLYVSASVDGKIESTIETTHNTVVSFDHGTVSLKNKNTRNSLTGSIEVNARAGIEPNFEIAIPLVGTIGKMSIEVGARATAKLRQEAAPDVSSVVCTDTTIETWVEVHGDFGLLSWQKQLKVLEETAGVKTVVSFGRPVWVRTMSKHFENGKEVPYCTAKKDSVCHFMVDDVEWLTQPCMLNHELQRPQSPVKEGYIFQNWHKISTLNDPWYFESDMVQEQDFRLYAAFVPEPTPTPEPGETPAPTNDPGGNTEPWFPEPPVQNGLEQDQYPGITFEFVGQLGKGVRANVSTIAEAITVPSTVTMVEYGYEPVYPGWTVMQIEADWYKYTRQENVTDLYISSAKAVYAPSVLTVGGSGGNNLISINCPNAEIVKSCAFDFCTQLKDVSLPSVTKIEHHAFRRCYSLANISVSSVRQIEDGTFYLCESMKSIFLPVATDIGEGIFDSCTSLQSIDLPSAVNFRGHPFLNCTNLKEASLPLATYLTENEFSGCTSLQSISLPLVTQIAERAFYDCSFLQEINLPAATQIGNSAFVGCTSLQSVNLPAVTQIEDYAFMSVESLWNVNLPEATHIGNYAFYNCTSLQNASLPVVLQIGEWAFQGCQLQNISLPSATHIGNYAFYNCYPLQKIDMPAATEIGERVFQSCSLQEVNLPAVTYIGNDAFIGCTSLQYLEIGPNIQHIVDLGWSPNVIRIASPDVVWDNPPYGRYYDPNIVYCPRGSTTETRFKEAGNYYDTFYIDEDIKAVFDSTGGNSIPDYIGEAHGKIEARPIPKREGYMFSGWYEKLEDGTISANEWNFDMEILKKSTTTLVAQWTPIDQGFQIESGMLLSTDWRVVDVIVPNAVHTLTWDCVGSGAQTIHIPASVTTIEAGAFIYATNLQSITVDAGNPNFKSIDGALYTVDGQLVACPSRISESEWTAAPETTSVWDWAFSYSHLSAIRFQAPLQAVTVSAFNECTRLETIRGMNSDTELKSTADELGIPYNLESLTLYINKNDLQQKMTVYVRADAMIFESASVVLNAAERTLDNARQGRWLTGWSESPDGLPLDLTTTAMPHHTYELYALFGPAFEAAPNASGVTLTKCNLNRAGVEIPNQLDGKLITEIAEGAFAASTKELTGRRGSVVETYAAQHGYRFNARMWKVTLQGDYGAELGSFAAEEGVLLTKPDIKREGQRIKNWKVDNQNWNFDTDLMPEHDITMIAEWENVVGSDIYIRTQTADGIVIQGAYSDEIILKIPNQLDGLPVIGIAENAFASSLNLEQITLPDTVKTIGSNAFADCKRLYAVNLGNGITDLGNAAFMGCSNLQAMHLPDTVKTIGSDCFSGCTNMTDVNVGSQVNSIGLRSFRMCLSLQNLTVAPENAHFKVQDGLLLTADGHKVIAFAQKAIDPNLIIPGGVTEIGPYALYGAQIDNLTLCQSLKTIGDHAFEACNGLKRLTIPTNLEAIGKFAFASVKLQTVMADGANPAITIGDAAFTNPSVTFFCTEGTAVANWALENGFQIAKTTFDGHLSLPADLTSIEADAFRGCASEWVTIPEGCLNIDNYAFAYSQVKRVDVPRSLTYISDNAFEGCAGVILYGTEGSYAQQYANRNGLGYISQ